MAGINFLTEIYKKDPDKVEKLLDSSLEISEKLDGSRFLIQRADGNKLAFFKRKDISISKIDRTLSKYYEKAIYHFDNLTEEQISKLPEGWRFGMEYFPNLHPVTITYDRLPLNNLVLTDIQVKNPKDKTIDVITDKETLKKWADILEVESPLIIFEGKLSNEQKRKLLEFLNTPYVDLINRFKTESFTTFILNLLNPELKTSFLNNDLNKDIDGLIFKFDKKEAFRISNPEITLKKQQRKEEKPSDIYNLTIVLLQEFLVSLDFRKFKLREKTFEERYLEFICIVYNKFLTTATYKINFSKGVDFDLPKFLTQEESSVNFKFVKNTETLNHLRESNTNRELFKILMASMRAHKKRASGFFIQELIYIHNKLVDKIADFIGNDVKESIFYSFDEFRSVYLSESENWQDEFGKERFDESEQLDFLENPAEPKLITDFPSFDQSKLSSDFIAPMEVLKKIFIPIESKEKDDNVKDVCLIKGKFEPFHNGHVSIIEDASKLSNMKVYLVVLNNRVKRIPVVLHSAMLLDVVKSNSNIAGFVLSNGRSMNEIIDSLPNDIRVKAFAGSAEECEDAKIQIADSIDTFPMTRHVHSKSILDKVIKEDFDGYKKLVPVILHNYFYKIKSELK